MAKIGIGVGEEFPVDESAPPRGPGGRGKGCGGQWRRRRHGGFHFALHVLFRIAVIGLVISLIVRLFRPHVYAPVYAPHGFYPYTHHLGFFFPGFLIFAVLFLLFSRGCFHGRRRWHHDHCDDRGEEN